VFAVAITLLVLNVKTPKAANLAAGHSSLTEVLTAPFPTSVLAEYIAAPKPERRS
jgi:uncharacterized membrane protein